MIVATELVGRFAPVRPDAVAALSEAELSRGVGPRTASDRTLQVAAPAAGNRVLVAGQTSSGAGRISRWAIRVVPFVEPVVQPIDSVARHVVDSVRRAASRIGTDRRALDVPIVYAGARIPALGKSIHVVDIREVRLAPVRRGVAPGVNPPICAARRLFPLGFRGKSEMQSGNHAHPRGVGHRVIPAHAEHGFVLPLGDIRCPPTGVVADVTGLLTQQPSARSASVTYPVSATKVRNCATVIGNLPIQ